MRAIWFGTALMVFMAGCTQSDDGMSQLQRQVKHGLSSVAMDVSDEQILAAPSGDVRRAYLILNSSGGPRETSDAKKRSQLRMIFEEGV